MIVLSPCRGLGAAVDKRRAEGSVGRSTATRRNSGPSSGLRVIQEQSGQSTAYRSGYTTWRTRGASWAMGAFPVEKFC